MRARTRRPLSRAARLTKEWIGFGIFDAVTSRPSSVLLAPGQMMGDWILSPQDTLDFFDEPTVLRMLIDAEIAPESIAAGSINLISMGIIVTGPEGPLGGAIGTWSPFQAPDYDWLWTKYYTVGAPNSSPVAAQGGYTSGISGDIRSKRIIPPGKGLALVITNEVPHFAGSSARIWVNGRFLVAH